MHISWLLEKMETLKEKEALVWKDTSYHYDWVIQRVAYWKEIIEKKNIISGQVVALLADYSPDATALMLALIDNGNIFVPLTDSVRHQHADFIEICEAQVVITLDDANSHQIEITNRIPTNELTTGLKATGEPGLVLFSSGSTGKSKAALHNFSKLLEKFKKPRNAKRMLAFLLLDHIGGINTLLYALSNGGAIVTVESRNPNEICRIIEKHKVQILPTSPTFLNLLLLSEAFQKYDISCLELITYGTEVMPENTLKMLTEKLPNVNLQQTYGLSELGILRSKSKSSDSLWVKVGGEGYDIKIVDNILWVKAESAMLGYLNAPSPFDEEGWFNTQDEVIVDGEYIRILGRKSEIINVGGEKVYPAEVESVLMEMEVIVDAAVTGEKNLLTGNIVVATVNLNQAMEPAEIRKRVKEFCQDRLAPFKIPVKVYIAENEQHSERFKKMRRKGANA